MNFFQRVLVCARWDLRIAVLKKLYSEDLAVIAKCFCGAILLIPYCIKLLLIPISLPLYWIYIAIFQIKKVESAERAMKSVDTE